MIGRTEANALTHQFLEAGLIDCDGICAWGEEGGDVAPEAIGDFNGAGVAINIGGGDGCAGDCGAGGIGDFAGKRSAKFLGVGGVEQEQKGKCEIALWMNPPE